MKSSDGMFTLANIPLEFSLLGAVKLATHYATAILLKSTLLTTYQVIPSWVHYPKEISISNKSCFVIL